MSIESKPGSASDEATLRRRDVDSSNGGRMSRGPRRSDALEEILEPVRRKIEASGMSEDELTRFLMEIRDEVRRAEP